MSAAAAIPFLALLLLTIPYSVAGNSHEKHHNHRHERAPQDSVRSSCVNASYPSVCLRTLSSYSGPTNSPRDLAQAAVRVTLSRARRVRAYLLRVAEEQKGGSRERSEVGDCVEHVSESVEELRKTVAELQNLRGETFRWQISNAETWVSAALTDEDTCVDGFGEMDGVGGGGGNVRSEVKRKIKGIAKVTSNALYMINRLDQSRPRSQLGRP